jgi:hypothetical protein
MTDRMMARAFDLAKVSGPLRVIEDDFLVKITQIRHQLNNLLTL